MSYEEERVTYAPERSGQIPRPAKHPLTVGDYVCDGDIVRTSSIQRCPYCFKNLDRLGTSGKFFKIVGPNLTDQEELPWDVFLLQCITCRESFVSNEP